MTLYITVVVIYSLVMGVSFGIVGLNIKNKFNKYFNRHSFKLGWGEFTKINRTALWSVKRQNIEELLLD